MAEVTVFAEVDATRNAKQFNYFANRMRKVAVDFVDNALFNVANKKYVCLCFSDCFNIDQISLLQRL